MFLFCNFLSFCEKNPHENRKLCCVWLLITFAFACVSIHGLHLKWSLRSLCHTTFGMFSFSYLRQLTSARICTRNSFVVTLGRVKGKSVTRFHTRVSCYTPRLPNLQQLFLKRNHRISTSCNTSSLSYPDIVLYLIPHFFV